MTTRIPTFRAWGRTLARALGIQASTGVMDDRYWGPVTSVLSNSGIRITPDLALACSCLYQGTRLISETVSSFPIKVLAEKDEDATELARANPLWDLLRRRPNSWQTPTEFYGVMTAHAILWNNAFAEIRSGNGRVVDQLVPIHPDRMAAEQLAEDRWRYRVKPWNGIGPDRVLVQEQVFHLRGFGVSPFLPMPLITLAREAIGLWTALEQFESAFFRQGARHSYILEHPNNPTKEVIEQLKEDLREQKSGLINMHQPFIATGGMKLKEFGFNLRDSQATESRAFMVAEIARWLNLPEYKLGGTKQPTFASVEQFARDYVDTTIIPWTTRWEQRIEADLLVVDPERTSVKFVLDALLRGSTGDRAAAYAIFVTNGIFTRNEVRRKEDMNPLPGLDEPLTPANMIPGAQPATPAPTGTRRPAAPPADEGDDEDESARAPRKLVLLARSSAARVWRKESAAIQAHAVKLAGKPEAFVAWAGEFYDAHAATVAEALQLEPLLAREYADAHRSLLLAEGVGIVERWEREAPVELARLALVEPALPEAPQAVPVPPAPKVTTRQVVRNPKTLLIEKIVETTA
jgi:HK97 family phage portal protein